MRPSLDIVTTEKKSLNELYLFLPRNIKKGRLRARFYPEDQEDEDAEEQEEQEDKKKEKKRNKKKRKKKKKEPTLVREERPEYDYRWSFYNPIRLPYLYLPVLDQNRVKFKIIRNKVHIYPRSRLNEQTYFSNNLTLKEFIEKNEHHIVNEINRENTLYFLPILEQNEIRVKYDVKAKILIHPPQKNLVKMRCDPVGSITNQTIKEFIILHKQHIINECIKSKATTNTNANNEHAMKDKGIKKKRIRRKASIKEKDGSKLIFLQGEHRAFITFLFHNLENPEILLRIFENIFYYFDLELLLNIFGYGQPITKDNLPFNYEHIFAKQNKQECPYRIKRQLCLYEDKDNSTIDGIHCDTFQSCIDCDKEYLRYVLWKLIAGTDHEKIIHFDAFIVYWHKIFSLHLKGKETCILMNPLNYLRGGLAHDLYNWVKYNPSNLKRTQLCKECGNFYIAGQGFEKRLKSDSIPKCNQCEKELKTQDQNRRNKKDRIANDLVKCWDKVGDINNIKETALDAVNLYFSSKERRPKKFKDDFLFNALIEYINLINNGSSKGDAFDTLISNLMSIE